MRSSESRCPRFSVHSRRISSLRFDDASRPAATAQRLRFDPDPAIPEPIVAGTDILHVDVWAPPEGAGHPVLVWIHGGAFTRGSNRLSIYAGDTFARDGVVLVTINYRLGALGGFAHPALTRAAKPGERDSR